jgi:osmotically-inducible protein OsmY
MKRNLTLAAALISSALLLGGSAHAASAPANDLTPSFKAAGIQIDRLQATEVGGIVILRGRVADRAAALEAGRFAQTLGYKRVANLIQVTTPPDDAAIARKAERELAIHRSLDGCNFRVGSDKGVVRVAGTVRHELQKDVAVELLRNIDGVRAVRADLDRF